MVKQSLTPEQNEWRKRATLHLVEMRRKTPFRPRIRIICKLPPKIVCKPSETCITIPGKTTVKKAAVRKPSPKERLAKKMWELHRKNHFRSRITNFNPRGPSY